MVRVMDSPVPMPSALLVKNGSARPLPCSPGPLYGLPTASSPVPAACPVEAMMARSWSPILFRKAFYIKCNDDLRWVSLTYGFQVF